jgi:PAS domain S-box-containing protein
MRDKLLIRKYGIRQLKRISRNRMIHVLYIDDEPDLLDIGKTFLEKDGRFLVDITSSATDALALLESSVYEAIVSDYQMPGMNGIELLRQIRATGNRIPFIIFTGRGREEIVIQALNEGADFYLQKGGTPKPQFTELAHKIWQAIQQRRAEERICEHEHREADILNFLPDATLAIDTSGVVIAWNLAMERLTGVPASAIVGKGNYEYAIPFYHERRPVLIDLVLASDPSTKARYPFIKRDGSTLFSEIAIPHFHDGRGALLWITASPQYDIRGRVVGAIESIRDITDRKKGKEALAQEQRFFDAVIDSMPGIFFVLDKDGRFVRGNRYVGEALGLSAEELAGTYAPSLILEEDRPAVEHALEEIFSTGYGETRARIIGRRNLVRDYILTGRRMEFMGDVYAVGTGTDLTEENG